MVHLVVLNISAMGNFGIVSLFLSLEDEILSFIGVGELIDDFFCEKIRVDDFGFEGGGSLKQFLLPYIFAFMDVGIEFTWILYIASNEVSVWIYF